MVTIKRINVASAFKVGAALSALVWVILAVIIFILQTVTADETTTGIYGSFFGIDFSHLFSIYIGGVPIYAVCGIPIYAVCGIPFYAVSGGIGAAAIAWLYNVLVDWFDGGIEVKVLVHDETLTEWARRSAEIAEWDERLRRQ
jgi:hypothetical protein